MNIKILGPGCPRCNSLEKVVNDALKELSINARVEKITDVVKMMDYKILMTPALVINEKVKVYGRVPSKEEVINWIKEEANE